MGQLLSSLNLRHNVDTVPENNGFDIENATPLSDELGIYNELFALLVQPNSKLLSLLNTYTPASEQIRIAIATPSDQNEINAIEAVSPTIDMLRQFYEYSSDLEKGIPLLLDALFKNGSAKDLNNHPGLTKLYANIMDFVFDFDCLKIRNPTLQNDFSYYRRTLQRGRISKYNYNKTTSISDGRSIEDDLANRISLFIAYPTPMLKCVIDTITKYVKTNQSQQTTTEWLASVWAACFHAVDIKKRRKDSSSLKVMVISIILYDHIDPSGVFSKYSPINVKNSLKIIRSMNSDNTQEQSTTPNLISTLRHNSKHLNDDSTPKGVKNLVMAT